MTELTDEQVLEAVTAEMRPGGRPVAKYVELRVAETRSWLAATLTTKFFENVEERLCRLEQPFTESSE